MLLSNEQQKDLDKINDKMGKCNKCKVKIFKGYCGRCDEFYYECNCKNLGHEHSVILRRD
jgi:hypothetical protein